MDLPIWIVDAAPLETVISVDGAFDAHGLSLSHWPGNATPVALKHDLSTGIALAFGRLAPSERERLADGAVAVANNHYDTDGVCAIFAVRHPELAQPRAAELLAAAEAGDLFRHPSDLAFQIDCVIGGLADPERSPWSSRFAGGSNRDRYELCVRDLMTELPRLLDGDVERFGDLWRAPLDDLHADRADLARAARDDITHLDLTVFTAADAVVSSRLHRSPEGSGDLLSFDPGRHALFGSAAADRVLVVGPERDRATYRFLVNTTSWFDMVTRSAQPRPDMQALAQRLNDLEGTAPDDDLAWRAELTATPSPELWFGALGKALFAEHARALAPSKLSPAVVRRAVADALRATWVFPD